jgi:hypothetical protein
VTHQVLGAKSLCGVDALLLCDPRLVVVCRAVGLGNLVALFASERIELAVEQVEEGAREKLELLGALELRGAGGLV